jgi:hypothetical protein
MEEDKKLTDFEEDDLSYLDNVPLEVLEKVLKKLEEMEKDN